MKERILTIFLILALCMSLIVPVLAASPAEDYFVFDEAELLNDADEAQLTAKLSNLSHTYSAQLIVATVSSTADTDIESYVTSIYQSMGFGYGEDSDGVLLLISMEPRKYAIYAKGFPEETIGETEIDIIGDAITPDLSAENYIAAFLEFADQCDYYLDGYVNGFPFKFGRNLLICLVIGFVVGLIVALNLKGQLKTVRKQNKADVYVKPGSMQISLSNDMFLYRNVTRTKKQSSSSSGSGSSGTVGSGSF